jgi:hypothetical protein
MQALRDKLERDAIELNGAARLAETTAPARIIANLPLASLADEKLAGRFRHWRGASGRRYIFSLYEPESCPAYDDAVLIVAAKCPGGLRRIVTICDTGALPELALARAREAAATLDESVECHIHLLAASRDERAAAIEDLRPADGDGAAQIKPTPLPGVRNSGTQR